MTDRMTFRTFPTMFKLAANSSGRASTMRRRQDETVFTRRKVVAQRTQPTQAVLSRKSPATASRACSPGLELLRKLEISGWCRAAPGMLPKTTASASPGLGPFVFKDWPDTADLSFVGCRTDAHSKRTLTCNRPESTGD
jgi:hypothetical protein